MDEDILTPALDLEQTYYNEGHILGHEDGTKAGQLEGRRFGIEKGFDKFSSMARLHGRAIVWNTIYSSKPSSKTVRPISSISLPLENTEDPHPTRIFLPQLFNPSDIAEDHSIDPDLEPPPLELHTRISERIEKPEGALRVGKHVAVLYALTEVESLSMENTEEAVSDFDDRYRRAVSKVGIIGRILGEDFDAVGKEDGGGDGEGELEDIAYKGRNAVTRDSDVRSGLDRSGEELEIEIR